MKKLLSILTLMTFIFGVTFAQVDTDNTQNEVTEGAKMEFETVEVSYGQIEQNADPLRVFKFSNTGTEPLVIQHAKGSCGCTVPKYPKEPILPGETSEIEVRYDTKRLGPFTKTVTLTTNAVNHSDNKPTGTFLLKITGKVNPKAPEPEGVPASNSGFGSDG